MKGGSLLAVLPEHTYSAFLNSAVVLYVFVLIQNNLEEEFMRNIQFPQAIILFPLFDKEYPQL